MVIHKKCNYCEEIGHKIDMIININGGADGSYWNEYYHKECYKKNFNFENCLCGKGFISKK